MRKNKKQVKAVAKEEPLSQELLTDQDEAAEVRITLTAKVLEAEYNKQNIIPNCLFHIGSHVVYITNDPNILPEKLHRQFTGLVWLFKNRHAEESLGFCCSYQSVKMFFALKYGMSLFEYYKHPDKVATSLKNNEMIAQLDSQCKQQQYDHISDLLRNTSQYQIEFYTEEFGVIKLPTNEQIQEYLGIAKVVGSGFSRQCELHFQSG